jgi:undecaprenyl diphosphate synthase
VNIYFDEWGKFMQEKTQSTPRHIAIIMDGNRRWARQHGLQVLQGHDYVSEKVIEPLVDKAIELGVEYLTLWAFSTENWKRDKEEVGGLMQIFRKGLEKNGQRLFEKGVRLNAIGNLEKFPEDIKMGMQRWIEKTAQNDKITVTFALNYGGRDEILRAIKKAADSSPNSANILIDEQQFATYLDTAGMPDPDMIIRPGGEKRLSGYLPWQAVYAELYFTDVLMPDFSPAELEKAVEDFSNRKRRFGK